MNSLAAGKKTATEKGHCTERNVRTVHIKIDATRACQLGCTYCYFGPKSTEEMDPDAMLLAVSNLIGSMDSKPERVKVSYMGGEPILVWEKVCALNAKLKKMFHAQKISFVWSMTSNIIGLDRKKVDYMKSERAGLLCSVDGPQDIHDKNRPYVFHNGGSFLDVAKNIPLALEVGRSHVARITVCPEDAHRLPEIVSSISGMGFNELSVFPNTQMNWSSEDAKHWGTGMAETITTFSRNFPEKKLKTIVLKSTQGDNYLSRFPSCGIGRDAWAIGTDGLVFPCHRLTQSPQFAIVNAINGSPQEIIEAMRSSQQMFQGKISENCSGCVAQDHCDGGCWADNAIVNGNSNSPVDSLCLLKRETIIALQRLSISFKRTGIEETGWCLFGCDDRCCDDCPCVDCSSCDGW